MTSARVRPPSNPPLARSTIRAAVARGFDPTATPRISSRRTASYAAGDSGRSLEVICSVARCTIASNARSLGRTLTSRSRGSISPGSWAVRISRCAARRPRRPSSGRW
jgi:hypothetical protein